MTDTHRLIVGGALVLHGDVGDMFGDGSGFTGREVLEALTEFDGDLTVKINSGGGLIFDGLAIFNALKAHKGEVSMEISGVAASAASVIAMAGDTITMLEGSVMMLHDPSAVTIGPAAEHEKTAGVLNKLGDVSANIYAERSGKSKDEVRDVMLAETWFTAEEAIKFGLADSGKAEPAQAAAAFDWSVYQNVPAYLSGSKTKKLPTQDVAAATMKRGKDMPIKDKVADPVVTADAAKKEAAPVAPAKQDISREVLNRCRAAKLDIDKTYEIIEAAGDSMDKALDLIFQSLESRDPSPKVKAVTPTATVTADGKDRFMEGAEKGLMARCDMEGGERNEFTGMTLRELAKAALKANGITQTFADPMVMVAEAFKPRMAAGQHSTSDFSTLLANTANKAMLKGYEEQTESFERFTSRGTLSDFKIQTRVDLNLFPNLTAVPEGAEYSYATLTDRSSTIQLATYGKKFAITRQAIINDDTSSFTRIPQKMGRAARRTVADLVWAVITANANMPDGDPLFHANHGNLAGSGAAPSVVTLDAGRTAMARQRDVDNIAVALNIRPSYFLVPVELEASAKSLVASEFDPSKTQRVPNHVRGMAEVISDARLSINSTTAWYLAANPALIETIEVAYLNGVSAPMLERRDGWDVDGQEYKVRLDAGVQVHDFRGLYKDPGA